MTWGTLIGTFRRPPWATICCLVFWGIGIERSVLFSCVKLSDLDSYVTKECGIHKGPDTDVAMDYLMAEFGSIQVHKAIVTHPRLLRKKNHKTDFW